MNPKVLLTLIIIFWSLNGKSEGFSTSIHLKDIIILSDGVTSNLGVLQTPDLCEDGSFSFQIDVERTTGVGDQLLEMVDMNGRRIPFFGGESKRMSHLPKIIKFENKNTGVYREDCKCFENPGSEAVIRISHLQFHSSTNGRYCTIQRSGNFTVPTDWIHRPSISGSLFNNVTFIFIPKLQVRPNYVNTECYGLAFKNKENISTRIDSVSSIIKFTMPSRFYTYYDCISPKINSKYPDFQVELKMIGVLNE
jgi:hypothetical protein